MQLTEANISLSSASSARLIENPRFCRTVLILFSALTHQDIY